VLLFVVLSIAILTGLAATPIPMSSTAPAFADKKRCVDSDNDSDNNCNRTHKSEKTEQAHKCKIQDESVDHSSQNDNENRFNCVTFGDAESNGDDSGDQGAQFPGKLIVTKKIICVDPCPGVTAADIDVSAFGDSPGLSVGVEEFRDGFVMFVGEGRILTFASIHAPGFWSETFSDGCRQFINRAHPIADCTITFTGRGP
jgi:hypothetical protein